MGGNVIARWRKEDSCSVVMNLFAVKWKTETVSSELMDVAKETLRQTLKSGF